MLEIAGYELIEKIADGGMGTVWKAHQLSLDRLVAIKIMDASSLPNQEARDRFRKEAQIAARLSHHGIVQVYDTGEVDGSAYLVMEYVDGESVGDYIQLHGALKEARALEIVESVARSLAYAWEKECLIHCDINPNNILINRGTGSVKVADLGLARMISIRHEQTDDEQIIGTPNYTSPEQSAGVSDLDCRSDMYSLGATLYHMVTGQLPFHDATGSQAMTRHEEDFLADPMEVNPELSASTAWLIEKLMIKNRALRPHFWTQTIKDIEEVRQGRPPHPPLPDEGSSTVLRSSARTQVKSSKPRVIVSSKAGGEPKKLTLKKTELEEMVQVKPRNENQVGNALRNLGFLLFLAIVVYAALLYHGKVQGPPVPFQLEHELAFPSEESEAQRDDEVVEEPSVKSPDEWKNEDFIQGARLFNQALADYNAYQSSRSDPEVLNLVEKRCREAIDHFEACRAEAPEVVDIDLYVKQCYGLIANVRHSSMLSSEEESSGLTEDSPEVSDATETTPSVNKVVFVDDEPDVLAEPFPEEVTENLLRISLNSGWETPGPGVVVYGRELNRLLARYATPTRDTEVNSELILYPGIKCMMTAKDAARALNLDLPMKRLVETPGFPTASLYAYQFSGDFSGANQLSIVCDQNDRVIMVQLYDDKSVPARMEQALFSNNWSVYDFVDARTRKETDGLIAHRVRMRDQLVRIDTELAAENGERMVKARVALTMPLQLAGMILHVTRDSR